jgi:uncharacterized membrane-anchored protein YitT (DUF2179 family)
LRNSTNKILTRFKYLFSDDRSRTVESLQRRREAKRLRKKIRVQFRDILFMATGVLSAGFGLRGFLMPSQLIDGGVTGISLLVNNQTSIPLSVLIIIFNLPFLLLGFRQVSRVFAFKSIVAITALALVVAFVPYPTITQDKILIAVFGGFFLGAGIGMSMRGGGVIDGTEVLAIHLSKKSSLTVGDFILGFNILIFFVAAYLLSREIALYSILTYLAASRTVDFILEGIEEYTGVSIISIRSRQIIDMVKNDLGYGLTVYSGRRGFGKSGASDQHVDIIFIVITRLEINRLTTEIEKIDPKAFITMHSIKDTRGGMVKKRSIKEK